MNIAETKENIKVIDVKIKNENYKIIVDFEDYIKIANKEMIIVKQHGFATANIYVDNKLKRRKSLGKIILQTEKNVYMKDRYVSKNKNVLNYRKENLSTNIKDMEGYSEAARKKYFDNIAKNGIVKRKKILYTNDISYKFMKDKLGEQNVKSKLSKKDIDSIRDIYLTGNVTQEFLAKKYKVSRSTISSIVTYKRWKDTNDLSKRRYKEDILKVLNDKNFGEGSLFDLKNIHSYCTYYIDNEELYYYIERLNEDNLMYMEVRNKDRNIILKGDLLFLDELNKQTKREYSISSKYPAKTPVNLLVMYMNKLKDYI